MKLSASSCFKIFLDFKEISIAATQWSFKTESPNIKFHKLHSGQSSMNSKMEVFVLFFFFFFLKYVLQLLDEMC